MIADLLGLTALLCVAFCVLLCARRWPVIALVLLVAFVVRAGAALFHCYVAPLLDGTADAITFERVAWEWSQGGMQLWWASFTGQSSYFISWILAFFYTVTDRSLLMAQSVSIWFGMGTVVLGWLLARELWDEKAAVKAAWVLALFPTLVLYSALTMREAYVWFFLLLALLGVLRWARSGKFSAMILALLGFTGATFFHGAMIVGALVFLVLAGLRSLRQGVISLIRARLRVFALLLVVVTAGLVGWYATGGPSVPYLGTIEQATDAERLLGRFDTFTWGTAAYPAWTLPRSPAEIFWKAPVRGAYFLFSPFPWDVRADRHLIGLFDGLLYLVLAVLVCRNRRRIWAAPGGRDVMFVLLAMILVFGIAIGNFGTAVRHRAKFVAPLIVLAAPLLPRLVWRRSGHVVKPDYPSHAIASGHRFIPDYYFVTGEKLSRKR